MRNVNYLLIFFLVLPPSKFALAQWKPDAGSISSDLRSENLQKMRTAEATSKQRQQPFDTKISDDATLIQVNHIEISGVTLFRQDTIDVLVADVLLGAHTLGELQVAVNRITLHYRKAGYFLARAYLPAQKLADGVLTISVQEGKLGDIALENTTRLQGETIRDYLSDLKLGNVLQKEPLDKTLLLLGDIPGVASADARLVPGKLAGETMLVVTTKPAPAWAGKVEADNYGAPSTGVHRVAATVEGNSPWGFGEKLSANLFATEENMLYGRVAVQVPLGYHGAALAVGLSKTQYTLGDTFKALDATGQSVAQDFVLRYPLKRAVDANIYLQGGIEHRNLRDEVRSTNTLTDKEATVGNLAVQVDWRDKLGGLAASNQASASISSGQLSIGTPSAAAIDAAAAKTAGDYAKLAVTASRQQALSQTWSVLGQLRGQWANKNLDSSEKLSLGGVNGVRAYPSGEASGDNGWLGSLELRCSISNSMVASVFYDAGAVQINSNPYLTTSNERTISGSGIGLSGTHVGVDWRVMMAWRDTGPSTSEADKSPRLWAQASLRF